MTLPPFGGRNQLNIPKVSVFSSLKFTIYKPVFAFIMSCSINNKLQQPEAASGVLEYAMKHFSELVSVYYIYFI